MHLEANSSKIAMDNSFSNSRIISANSTKVYTKSPSRPLRVLIFKVIIRVLMLQVILKVPIPKTLIFKVPILKVLIVKVLIFKVLIVPVLIVPVLIVPVPKAKAPKAPKAPTFNNPAVAHNSRRPKPVAVVAVVVAVVEAGPAQGVAGLLLLKITIKKSTLIKKNWRINIRITSIVLTELYFIR